MLSFSLWVEPAVVARSHGVNQVSAPGLPPTATPYPTATPRPAPPPSAATTTLAFPVPPIRARSAYLLDFDTGKVLYQKNANAPLPMASTTKITTAAVVLQQGHLNDLVTVSHAAATVGESTMALHQGEQVTVRQLLYGMLLNSGNDAAVALAEHVGGTVSHFVAMMNELARSLHMSHTHYVTPHGLDRPGHYTSAHDLATIAAYAMRDPLFRKIVDTESYYVPATRHNRVHWLGNINQLLYWYPGADGVKPGDTDRAGLCQVISVRRDGRHLLAVVMHTPNLITDVRNLLNFGLHDFRWQQGPAWWDRPDATISGRSGARAWTYVLGAGHYIRGPFLAYFKTHGALNTLGYPRTEAFTLDGHEVQYFQGGELIDWHGSVYAAALGPDIASRMHLTSGSVVDARFQPTFHRLGGLKVFGRPITQAAYRNGALLQIYRHGALQQTPAGIQVIPLGDLALRLHGWLSPRDGDARPPDMSADMRPHSR
ncbi:MAG: serine hydrolase [Chloroflexota bacterium]